MSIWVCFFSLHLGAHGRWDAFVVQMGQACLEARVSRSGFLCGNTNRSSIALKARAREMHLKEMILEGGGAR